MWTLPHPGARFIAMNEKAASIPSYQPLYGQIKSLLVSSLANGEWKPGQMIPSESELASRFGVSQGTVRKAIDELATDNLLMRRQGRGTFVATHAEDGNSTRFLRLRAADGSAGPHGSRLVDCRRGAASGRAAALLRLAPGEPVIEVRRVLTFSGAGVIHDRIVLPASVFGTLDASVIEAWEGSMYSLFEARFGVRLIRAAHAAFERAVGRDEPGADEDLAFHVAIANATGNAQFPEFLRFLGRVVIPRHDQRIWTMTIDRKADYLALIKGEHARIVEAVAEGDAEGARQAMRAHLTRAAARYRKFAGPAKAGEAA